MGNRNQGVTTMGGLFEALDHGVRFYEDSTTGNWKKGDKVPKGYRVVFGKLRKVGGGGAQVASAPAPSSGGGGRKDASWQELGLFGDEGSKSSDADAKAAAKDINGLINHWGDWAEKNKDKFRLSKNSDSIFFDDDEIDNLINHDVKSTLRAHSHTGAEDSDVKDEVYSRIWSAMRKVHGR
jgi:hypothetical protein